MKRVIQDLVSEMEITTNTDYFQLPGFYEIRDPSSGDIILTVDFNKAEIEGALLSILSDRLMMQQMKDPKHGPLYTSSFMHCAMAAGDLVKVQEARTGISWMEKYTYSGYRTHSIGKANSIKLLESEWWKHCSELQIAGFQLFIKEMVTPLDIFKDSVSTAIGHEVTVDELTSAKTISDFLGDDNEPDIEQVMMNIPEEFRMLIAEE